jgi:hypothetical protein
MLGVLTSIDEGGPTMLAEYDGRQIVGIDLHRRRTVIVRMTEAGDQLGCVRIDNDPLVLAAEIAKAGEHPDAVLKAPMAGTGRSTCSRMPALRSISRTRSG